MKEIFYKKYICLFFFMIFLFLSSLGYGAGLYVDPGMPDNSGDGLSDQRQLLFPLNDN